MQQREGTWNKVLLETCDFWLGCEQTWISKTISGSLSAFVQRFASVHNNLDAIYFPVNVRNVHWIMGGISFKEKEIQIADGLNWPSPAKFYEKISYLLSTHLHVDLSDWHRGWRRIQCPKQNDSSSCGVITLCLMEQLTSSGKIHKWNDKEATTFRIKWLRRIVEYHTRASTDVQDAIERVNKTRASEDYYKVHAASVCANTGQCSK